MVVAVAVVAAEVPGNPLPRFRASNASDSLRLMRENGG